MASPDPRLMTVFSDALERSDPAVRAAYLDGACRGNAELRRLVEELLAAHDGAGRFLEPGPPEVPEPPRPRLSPIPAKPRAGPLPPRGRSRSIMIRRPGLPGSPAASIRLAAEAEGTVIAGRYKLLQQIGEGGMGTVWMADQTEPVRRRVAVKLIRVERGSRGRSSRGSRPSGRPSP